MQAFVDNLLDLRKFKDKTFSLSREVINFHQIVTVVKNIFEPLTSAKDIQLDIKLDTGLATPQIFSLLSESKDVE